jgi:hypothetical protein
LNSLFRLPAIKRKNPGETEQYVYPEANKDTVPQAESSFVDVFLSPALKVKSEDTKQFSNRLQDTANFLNSNVFFNHWIRTDDVLRPSVLVKAWNRNAAIICETGATGIDFVIPVMMERSHNLPQASQLGRCTKPWNEDQQKAASKLISYILIQTRDRESSGSCDRLSEMIDTVPLKRGLNKHPNFVDHDPQNIFLSILLDFRLEQVKRPWFELIWTRCALEAKHKEALSKVASLQKSVKDTKALTSLALQKAQTEENVCKTRIDIATHQIPIASYGLNGATFKCLETRPRLTARLQELLTATIAPLHNLLGSVRKELLESRVCVWGADRRVGEPSIAQVE